MDDKSFQLLIRNALEYVEKQKAWCRDRFDLYRFHRMDYEQETGEMIFSDPGVHPKVVAEFQFIGSLSSTSRTWLWAWDNPYLLEKPTEAVHQVRQFGEKHQLNKLITPKWPASEDDAMEMNALAAYVLKADGIYNFPSDNIGVYVVLTDIRRIGME
jgi:hypothetical protein